MSIPAVKTGSTDWSEGRRIGGLRRFAFAITLINVLGHTVLGFEQSWVQPFVCLAVAYTLEILFETLDAARLGRAPRYRGGPRAMIDFLLSAHITGLAVAMLLYANSRVGPLAFAAAIAITSKHLLQVTFGRRRGHFLNPSNFGIAVTLLAFPAVGVAPPYQFTADLRGPLDWIVPGIIVCTGTFLNARFTRKLPLIAAFLLTFAGQAFVRSALFGTPLVAALVPMTGPAFVLFTFYMITDPGTTPGPRREQILFGAAVACAYGILVANHVVFGLFFALAIVCLARGLSGVVAAALAPAGGSADLSTVSVPAISPGRDT